MSQAYFEVKDFHVSYGKKNIVSDVSFTLAQGELCALLGRNGCGKTTLLKGMLGFIPSRGDILVEGRSILSLSRKDRAKRISYVAQRSEVIYSISARDLILMGLNPHLDILQHIDVSQRNKVEAAASELEIEYLLDMDYLQLSEGQKQLVIIARSLVQNSDVLLLDEPDSAMDFVVRHAILSKVKELLFNTHKSALITMHDPNFALRYCDKILLMKDGVIFDVIDTIKDDVNQIQEKLRSIYDDVDLLTHNGTPYMVKS